MGAVHPGLATVTLGTAGLAILATERPLAGFGGMMITHHAVPGMWQVEGLSNAAAASLRWFRDVVATQERQIEAATGVDAYQQLDQLAATATRRQPRSACSSPTWPRPPRRTGTRKPALLGSVCRSRTGEPS
jgi:sugar (pentulose or hexulose) kinase